MPTYRDRGIVLKIRPTRDADRRYTVFTESHGKIDVLAVGTRRGRSKMSPHMGGLGVVELMVARGRRADRLAGASLARPFRGVMASLAKTSMTQSFLLLVDALTRRELPEERIFALLCEFLEAVDPAPEPARAARPAVFDAAAVKLLDILGFAPELGSCVACRRPLSPAEDDVVSVVRGGAVCRACREPASLTLTSGGLETLRRFRREPLAAFAAAEVPGSAGVGPVTEALIGYHCEGRLPALNYLRAVA